MYVFKLSGHSGFLWPGLNVPLMKDGAMQTIAQRSKEEQEKVEADMFQQREEWDRKRKMKVKRERGWSGNSWGGVSLGPPDPGPNGGSVLILLTFVTERLLVGLEFLNMSYIIIQLYLWNIRGPLPKVCRTQDAEHWVLTLLLCGSSGPSMWWSALWICTAVSQHNWSWGACGAAWCGSFHNRINQIVVIKPHRKMKEKFKVLLRPN